MSNPNFSFIPFLSYFCLYTQVHLPKLHKMIETTSQLRKISHTSPHPYFSTLKKQYSSSQFSADFNCQQQPHVSSSLHPLMSSDKLRRETHLLVTFYLLHFTSHTHTVQYKNSTVIHILFAGNTQARLPKYCIIYFPMAQQTHKKKKKTQLGLLLCENRYFKLQKF